VLPGSGEGGGQAPRWRGVRLYTYTPLEGGVLRLCIIAGGVVRVVAGR
jgi:hypothetical protein